MKPIGVIVLWSILAVYSGGTARCVRGDQAAPDLRLSAEVLDINDIYTVSLLIENPGFKKAHLSLGLGIQGDYRLEDLETGGTVSWSDEGEIFSYARSMDIAPRMTRVITNFPHAPIKAGARYRLIPKLTLLRSGESVVIEGDARDFFVDDLGRIQYPSILKKESPVAKPPISSNSQNEVFVYEGSGGSEWNTAGNAFTPSPGDPSGLLETFNTLVDDTPDESVPQGSSDEPDTAIVKSSKDLSDSQSADSEMSSTDSSESSGAVGYIGNVPDPTGEAEAEQESLLENEEEPDPSGIGIGGTGGGGGGSVFVNNTPPLLWIPSGNIWFVSDRTGSNSASGTNAAAPFKTITHAVNQAGTHDTVFIGAGIYDEGGLNIVKAIRLQGLEGAKETMIENGSASSRIVTLQEDSILDGLTIRNHAAANSAGGGVRITNNAHVQIHRSRIINNVGKRGSGIFMDINTSLELRDSLIADNLAKEIILGDGYGAGLYLQGANTLRLENVTVAHNFAEKEHGGIYIKSGADTVLEIVNSIIWGNRDEESSNSVALSNMNADPNAALLLSHSCFEGSLPQGFEVITNEGGNVINNPQFVNPYRRDYRLGFSANGALSPCVDTGVRLQVGANGDEDDMGCFIAMLVSSSVSLQTRLHRMGQLNADIQMGGSLLLRSLTYAGLGDTGALSYSLRNTDLSSRNYNEVLLMGASLENTIIEGDNNFDADFQATIVIEDASVSIRRINFVNTRKTIEVMNRSQREKTLEIRNCLFDLGQAEESNYVYLPDASVLALTGMSGSSSEIRFVNNTVIHGPVDQGGGIIYLSDGDESDSLIMVNNIDVMRGSSDFVNSNWNAISLPNVNRIVHLSHNDTWQGFGLIRHRKTTPDVTQTFLEREDVSDTSARNNLHINPNFNDFAGRDYHLHVTDSDLIDTGVLAKRILGVNTSAADLVTVSDTVFTTWDLRVGDKVKLVNPQTAREEFTVVSAIDRSDTGTDQIIFRNEWEWSYGPEDRSYLLSDFSEFRTEPEDNGDTINVGAYGNTTQAAVRSR